MKMRSGNSGKIRIRMILIACIILACLAAVSAASAEDWQAEARKMLQMINDFRTGDNAWYWNQSNTQQVVATGLKPLVYDLELEKVAQTRAQELSVRLSHTRPDGRKFSTAYPAGNYAKAENIAAGFRSAQAVFEGFLEESEDYDGQGHRRNMLRSNITRVGLAAVEIDGTVYWVQEFASGAVSSPAPTTGWVQEGGSYCYVLEDGSRATGWQQIGSDWYLFSDSGVMQTGWQESYGNWYYFGTDGAMKTGWQKMNDKWFYFGTDGILQTEWQKIDKKWYYFGKDGEMQTKWKQIEGAWYYFGKDGIMQTGWQMIDGQWYYFQSGGEMVTGRAVINGQTEIFTSGGVWQYSEIQDYATPLGDFSWRTIVQVIMQFLRTCFGALS